MTRLLIQAALFCIRMGNKEQALVCTRLALKEANREGARQCAGHLLSAIQKGQRA